MEKQHTNTEATSTCPNHSQALEVGRDSNQNFEGLRDRCQQLQHENRLLRDNLDALVHSSAKLWQAAQKVFPVLRD